MATLRTLLHTGYGAWLRQALVWLTAFSLAWLQVSPVYASAVAQNRENARRVAWVHAHTPHVHLPAGETQTPDAALWKRIEATEAARKAAEAARPVADVRPLSLKQMQHDRGRGPYRNPYFNGTLPWQRSLRDVNLCNGNLFKSFTDIQVAPGQGAGLVLQRTYNSNDARVGPFGVGWTHAYDIRIQEAADVQAQSGDPNADGTANDVPRTDFFGAKHTYHRDADGLYSPPAYMYDQMSSDYGNFLVNGPTKQQVMDDTETGEDGTIKHYANILTLSDGTSGNERACDYIQDRYGNKTTLTYGLSVSLPTDPAGSTRKLLTQVTDPTGRSLVFAWTNLNPGGAAAYRITQVQGPLVAGQVVSGTTYTVAYAYYNPGDPNAGGASYQLKSVALDSGGLNRTTTFTYTQYSDTGGTETGLLKSVADPLGNTVSYTYALNTTVTNTVWVSTVTEPAGVVPNTSTTRTLTWDIGADAGGNTYAGDYTVYFHTSDNSTLLLHMICDAQMRKLYYWLVEDASDPFQSTTYDSDNNALTQESDYNPGLGTNGFVERLDVATYGQHGNVLTQGQASAYGTPYTLYPGTTTTTYYNASQYFQKASLLDPDGHLTTMTVGTNTAGNPGDPDPNVGDRGQVLSVQDAAYNDVNSPLYHQKQFTYTYNQYGQKLSETNLNGTVTQYTYGTANDTVHGYYDLGNLTQVVQDPGTGHLNRTTSMHYDAMGRVIQSIDPLGLTSTFTYNTLGQPLSVVTPVKTGISSAETISYAYDANGRTHSVQDNRGVTLMAYEPGSDRVASVQDPVTGTTAYTYTLTGERNTMTLPGSATPWTYAYQTEGTYINWCNLPKDDPNSLTMTLQNIVDDQGRRIDFTIDLTGKMISSKTDEVYTTGASPSLVAYLETDPTFDVNSNQLTHFWLSQTATTWHWLSGSTWYSRLVSGNAYTYDNAGQRLTNAVTQMTPGAGGAPQYTGGTPTYDGNGNVTNEVLSTRTEKYEKSDGSSGYDDLKRLTNVDYGDGQTQSYGFDAMGNRLQRVDSASGTTSYAVDAANRLTGTTGAGASTYTNDADGNTLTGGGRTNTWDSQNRLVGCILGGNTSTFKYGADGLRRQKTTNSVTTDYAYDGTMLVREGHATGGSLTSSTVTATYLIGARGPEYRRDDTATETDSQGRTVTKARWYVYDGLGSVVGEVDPLGNLTSSPKYDVYGAVRSNSGTASSKQGFVGGLGHVSDDTGLIYMRARYMDPSLGRFVSEDPGKDGVNWFVYCDDDPINNVDADGKNSTRQDLAIFAGMLFLVAALLTMQTANKMTAYAQGLKQAELIAKATALGVLAAASFALASLDLYDSGTANAVSIAAGLLSGMIGYMTAAAASVGQGSPAAATVYGAYAYAMVVTGYLISDDIAAEQGK